MQDKKQQLEPDMEQWTGSKLGKEYVKAVYCYPAYLTYMQNTSCEMPGWMTHKLESILLREISTISDMQMLPLQWQKAGLKFNIQKTKILASSPITSWQIHGREVETVTDIIFLGPKTTVTEAIKLKDACSLKEKLWQT